MVIVPIEISLIDDVVFSGSMICKVADALKEKNIIVKEVLAGVAVDESLPLIQSQGMEIKSWFNISNVLDEVCERDFYFGMAQSGQSELQPDGTMLKKPYFSPFGSPQESASVPQEKETSFSSECLNCSYELWKDMQQNSNKILTLKDLPEKINNTPINEDLEILPYLQTVQESLLQQ